MSEDKKQTEEMWCGSRAGSPSSFPGPDQWEEKSNGDRTCSYCGSMHHEDFERVVKAAADPGSGVRIEKATGKNYKWYVKQPGVSSAHDGGIKFYTWHVGADDWVDAVNAIMPDAILASQSKFEAFRKEYLADMERTIREREESKDSA